MPVPSQEKNAEDLISKEQIMDRYTAVSAWMQFIDLWITEDIENVPPLVIRIGIRLAQQFN